MDTDSQHKAFMDILLTGMELWSVDSNGNTTFRPIRTIWDEEEFQLKLNGMYNEDDYIIDL